MIRPIRALTAALISATALAALSACGGAPAADTGSATADRTHAAPAVEGDANTPAPNRRELTETSINITWDSSTETDKDSMCDGIILFGPEWAADQMRDGAGSDASLLDWDYAAQLIEGKCDAR
jgi:hypothetical protein